MEISKFLALAVATFLLLLGGGICFVLDDEGTVVVKRPVPKQVLPNVQVDADKEKEPAEQKESGAEPSATPGADVSLEQVGADIHEDSVDETPPGITRDEADEALITPPNPLPADQEYEPQPQFGANTYRCPENFVRNYSSRATGVKVSMQVLHFTVSGPGSLRAIWNLFNNPSFGASSTFLVELDKECEQIVPFGGKPWTNGAFNSATETYEIVTFNLTRNEWLATPLIRDAFLAKIVASRLKARGLPPVLVDPVGCTPKAGVTDHDRLECGNNHWDVGPNFPWGEFMRDVKQIYAHGTVCDRQCRVVQGRDKRHRETHKKMKSLGCKGRIHSRPPSDYNRKKCRALKREDIRQRKGEARARAKQRS